MKGWVIFIIIIIGVFGYMYYTDTGIDFSNLKNSVVNTLESTTNQGVQEESSLISSCKEDFEFNADIRYSKYSNKISIESIKEVLDVDEANDFLKIWGYDAFYEGRICEVSPYGGGYRMDYYDLCDKDYPIVVIIASVESRNPQLEGQTSKSLICNNNGNLDEKSRKKVISLYNL